MNGQPVSIFVRESTTQDAAVIEQLLSLSRAESTLYRGSTYSQPSGSTSGALSLVGGVGSTVMGTLSAVRTVGRTWFIEYVFVMKDGREVGIADAMMLFALRHLTELDATRVESSAMPGDRATKNLFERHGLVAQTILVGKSLSDPSTAEHVSQ
jgi:hypothetical protein